MPVGLDTLLLLHNESVAINTKHFLFIKGKDNLIEIFNLIIKRIPEIKTLDCNNIQHIAVDLISNNISILIDQ